jgi:GT2 family glycosyltransferase
VRNGARSTTPAAPETAAVSAVVTNFNSGERLERVLRALEAQDVRVVETIVVDCGSSDDSLRRALRAFPAAAVVRLAENRGPGAARNAGLRRAASDLVLLLDHDVYLEPGALRALLEARRASGAAVAVPRIVLYPRTDTVQADGAEAHFLGTMTLRNAWRSRDGAPGVTRPVGACLSGCLLVERAVALEAAGYDEAYFFYLEDLEFGLRLRSRGHAIVVEPRAVALHDRGAGTPGLAFRDDAASRYPPLRGYYTQRNRLRIVLTYYRPRTLLALLPALAAYEGITLAGALTRGWAGEWARAWLATAGSAGAILRARRAVQGNRRVSDRALLSGGPVPLAPNFLRSDAERRWANGLSTALDGWWRVARRWIG